MINSNKNIIVGMADLNCAKHPIVLTTLGLGSCVGIALYDPTVKVVGMAHCMLPDSTTVKNNLNTAKFVDLATIKLIKDMIRLGAKQETIVAKIAGGAQMFDFGGSSQESFKIGDRNVESAEKILYKLRIPIISKDVGKNFGRTIHLSSNDGKLIVKTIEHGTYFI